MARHVALLRGINVGGRNKLPMSELVALFEAVGCRSVRTYIQSGNVVFEGGSALGRRVVHDIPRLVEERFGFRVPVLVRSAKDIHGAIAANPFLQEPTDPTHLHIGFLAAAPGETAIESLDPERSSTDRFVVRGREVYLHVPGGMARTRLTTDYFDRRLGTTMTVRNWRTVTRLAEMVRL
ncbi:MAG: DUF1697 domain-containing protein [Gemmatimonadota bacterium]|jgi:uncharacterized protein (DUF1697 family)